jgi:hypothetical protein
MEPFSLNRQVLMQSNSSENHFVDIRKEDRLPRHVASLTNEEINKLAKLYPVVRKEISRRAKALNVTKK